MIKWKQEEEVTIRKLVQQNISNSPKQETFVNNINHYEKALLTDRNTRIQIERWSILSDSII